MPWTTYCTSGNAIVRREAAVNAWALQPRDRHRRGEWFVTVDVDRGIVECCILHDWLVRRELGDAEAIKGHDWLVRRELGDAEAIKGTNRAAHVVILSMRFERSKIEKIREVARGQGV
jgi:hypothetical protein